MPLAVPGAGAGGAGAPSPPLAGPLLADDRLEKLSQGERRAPACGLAPGEPAAGAGLLSVAVLVLGLVLVLVLLLASENQVGPRVI